MILPIARGLKYSKVLSTGYSFVCCSHMGTVSDDASSCKRKKLYIHEVPQQAIAKIIEDCQLR